MDMYLFCRPIDQPAFVAQADKTVEYIQLGYDVSYTDEYGRTSLMLALNRPDATKFLKYNKNIKNKQDDQGNTALHYIQHHYHIPLLLNFVINNSGMDALASAVVRQAPTAVLQSLFAYRHFDHKHALSLLSKKQYLHVQPPITGRNYYYLNVDLEILLPKLPKLDFLIPEHFYINPTPYIYKKYSPEQRVEALMILSKKNSNHILDLIKYAKPIIKQHPQILKNYIDNNNALVVRLLQYCYF